MFRRGLSAWSDCIYRSGDAMAAPVSVRILRNTSIGGRALVRGELATVTPIEAVILARRGVATLRRESRAVARPAAPVVEAEPAEAPARGRYKRRDLRPED